MICSRCARLSEHEICLDCLAYEKQGERLKDSFLGKILCFIGIHHNDGDNTCNRCGMPFGMSERR